MGVSVAELAFLEHEIGLLLACLAIQHAKLTFCVFVHEEGLDNSNKTRLITGMDLLHSRALVEQEALLVFGIVVECRTPAVVFLALDSARLFSVFVVKL